jgi:hypothetical protein
MGRNRGHTGHDVPHVPKHIHTHPNQVTTHGDATKDRNGGTRLDRPRILMVDIVIDNRIIRAPATGAARILVLVETLSQYCIFGVAQWRDFHTTSLCSMGGKVLQDFDQQHTLLAEVLQDPYYITMLCNMPAIAQRRRCNVLPQCPHEETDKAASEPLGRSTAHVRRLVFDLNGYDMFVLCCELKDSPTPTTVIVALYTITPKLTALTQATS